MTLARWLGVNGKTIYELGKAGIAVRAGGTLQAGRERAALLRAYPLHGFNHARQRNRRRSALK